MLVVSHLRAFQALELALRTGSLKAAADLLGITAAAVGQRIKGLEDFLGHDLIVRGRSGLRPTPVLAKALDPLKRAFLELNNAAEALDFQRTNEIQIAADSDWVDLWLRPRLSQYRKQQPHTLFCINGEGEVPLRLGRSDVEVHFRAPHENENATVLFHDFIVPISSPDNVRRIGRLKKRASLEGFPLLHLDFYKNDPAALGWPEWIEKNSHERSAPQRGIRFQRIAPGVEAVVSHAGLMMCGLALILDRFKANDVMLPFPVQSGVPTSHAFVAAFRADSLLRPQVRRFRAWLETEARETVQALEAMTKR
jgi:LysR family transcriptional regulator, glycine cleavage system transcriptional activator